MLELKGRGRGTRRSIPSFANHKPLIRRTVIKSLFPTLVVMVALYVGQVAALRALAATHGDGELQINVVDAETHQPLAARMHLTSSRGKAIKLKVAGLNQYADHFYIDGRMTLPLMIGRYEFELEAGPEYKTQHGHFEIERHADDSKTIEMHRFADLA